uniref:Uncharacterized protein n=1 Tax=Siphoviridae sp. cttpk5 TaxID=2826496 RepID=A0A8S5NIX6_9CAUD|nr:MAG TPA: hypothetical protein [Siphoviridae sp. cttpk5]
MQCKPLQWREIFQTSMQFFRIFLKAVFYFGFKRAD